MVFRKQLRLTTRPLIDGQIETDIRWWEVSPTGGMPTSQAIQVNSRELIQLIMHLQGIHRDAAHDATVTTESEN